MCGPLQHRTPSAKLTSAGSPPISSARNSTNCEKDNPPKIAAGSCRRRPKFGSITLHGLALGSGRSVSLFACVDGFCEVFFPSVSHILDLSTNFFTCGCDLVQSAPEFASE